MALRRWISCGVGSCRAVFLHDALLLDVELLQLELCALDALCELLRHLLLELLRDLGLDRHRHLERNRIHGIPLFCFSASCSRYKNSGNAHAMQMHVGDAALFK